MSSLCGIQFSFLFRDGYLIFSLDLLRFDVADLWPKFQFDSLNFEGIIRFEVSFFPLALHSFLTSVRPSFCSCTGKRREAGGYGWTRYIGTHRSRAAEALQRSCFFRGYNEDATTHTLTPHVSTRASSHTPWRDWEALVCGKRAVPMNTHACVP